MYVKEPLRARYIHGHERARNFSSPEDLSVVLRSDPCEERSVQVQTVLSRVDVHSIKEEVNRSKE